MVPSRLNWRKPIAMAVLGATRMTVLRELRLLRSMERRAFTERRGIHEGRLTDVLRHACRQTEYYREVLAECGVVRDGRVDLSRFKQIPFLTKEIVRREGDRLRARELPAGRRSYVNRTGGSTGEPVEFWQDTHYWDVVVATRINHFERFGKKIGEPEMKVWGSDRDIVHDTSSWQGKLQSFLYNRRIRTCSSLSEDGIRAIIEEVNRYKPRNVWAYVDGMYTIADYVLRCGFKVHAPSAIFIGGGTLLPRMRDVIQEAFGAPVINLYGSREMGDIACECERQNGLHVSELDHRVEVVDADGRAVRDTDGEIVVTSLCNYAMPLLRYRTGDRGRLTARICDCGRSSPLLSAVSGRGMESLIASDGAIVSPIYLITTLGAALDPRMVKKFQIIQEDRHQVRVKVILHDETRYDEGRSALQGITAKIRSVMGPKCAVSVDFVDHIPPTRSGKYLYTMCKVPQDGLPLSPFRG